MSDGYSLNIAGLIGMLRGSVDLNPASNVNSNLSVYPSTESDSSGSSNVCLLYTSDAADE